MSKEPKNPLWNPLVPLTRHDPKDLGLICLVKKRKIRFQIVSDLKIQSWIFIKKRTFSPPFFSNIIAFSMKLLLISNECNHCSKSLLKPFNT